MYAACNWTICLEDPKSLEVAIKISIQSCSQSGVWLQFFLYAMENLVYVMPNFG